MKFRALKISALVLAFTIVAGLALAGCQSSQDKPSGAPGPASSQDAQQPGKTGGFKIGVSNFSLGNTYRVQNIESISYRAEQLKQEGVIESITITNSDGDANKQIADVQDLITAGCDALIITAASPTNLNTVIEEAVEKGIVVVTFNSQPSTDAVTCRIMESEVDFGKVGGEWLIDKLDGKGKIIVLNGIAGDNVNDLRYQEPKRLFEENPDITILGEVFATWDYAQAKVAVENLLAANPEIDGVYSQGGAMTLAAVDAFVAAGRPLVPMTGESNNGLLKAWKKYMGQDNFDLICPIVNDQTGTMALEYAIKALQGEDIPKEVPVPLDVITADNMGDYIKEDLPDSYWVGSKLPDEKILELFSK